MGLQEILSHIQKETETENTEAIKQANAAAEKMLLERLEEINRVYEKKKTGLEVELKRLSAKLLAKSELDAYRERQRLELEMLDSLLKEAYQELLQNLKKDSAKYRRFLLRIVQQSVPLIEGSEMGVSFNKEDEVYFDQIKSDVKAGLKLLPSSKIDGGVICSSKDIYIDSSLENIYNKMRPELIKLAAGMFL
jgi:vacuolar-type H+-ATPase subunit E/Vma4